MTYNENNKKQLCATTNVLSPNRLWWLICKEAVISFY